MPGPRIIASSLIRVIADQNLESQYDRWADEKEIAAREAKYADPLDAYDEVEHLITKLDRDWQDLQPIARSYIRSAASVHILCFACLEAHINIRAEERLQGRSFGEFDRLPTTGKWFFYPRTISVGEFEPGAEPLPPIPGHKSGLRFITVSPGRRACGPAGRNCRSARRPGRTGFRSTWSHPAHPAPTPCSRSPGRRSIWTGPR
jgi:hypothetical protein